MFNRWQDKGYKFIKCVSCYFTKKDVPKTDYMKKYWNDFRNGNKEQDILPYIVLSVWRF